MQHTLSSLALNEDGAVAQASSEARDSNGMTALLQAAANNDRIKVKELIRSGSDPSAADGQGLTALHYAAIDGNTKLARILLEHGPAGLVLCEAPGGETSLWCACQGEASQGCNDTD